MEHPGTRMVGTDDSDFQSRSDKAVCIQQVGRTKQNRNPSIRHTPLHHQPYTKGCPMKTLRPFGGKL